MRSTLTDSIAWFERHIGVAIGLVVGWVLTLLVSAWVVHRFLITIPPDYYQRPHQPLEFLRLSHPALRWSLLIGKNVLGAVLVAAGLVMLLTPGQGVLTLLLGLALIDIPGKRAVESRIIRRPTVLTLVNVLRASANRPPLEFVDDYPPTPPIDAVKP